MTRARTSIPFASSDLVVIRVLVINLTWVALLHGQGGSEHLRLLDCPVPPRMKAGRPPGLGIVTVTNQVDGGRTVQVGLLHNGAGKVRSPQVGTAEVRSF